MMEKENRGVSHMSDEADVVDGAGFRALDIETAALKLARSYNLDFELTLRDILPEGDADIPWSQIREDLGKGVIESPPSEGV